MRNGTTRDERRVSNPPGSGERTAPSPSAPPETASPDQGDAQVESRPAELSPAHLQQISQLVAVALDGVGSWPAEREDGNLYEREPEERRLIRTFTDWIVKSDHSPDEILEALNSIVPWGATQNRWRTQWLWWRDRDRFPKNLCRLCDGYNEAMEAEVTDQELERGCDETAEQAYDDPSDGRLTAEECYRRLMSLEDSDW